MAWLRKKASGTGDDETARLTDFIEGSPIAIARMDEQGVILESNRSFKELIRNSFGDDQKIKLADLIMQPEPRHKIKGMLQRTLAGDISTDPTAMELSLPDGVTITVALFFSLLQQGPDGHPAIIAHLIDTTEQKNLELRFAHSQKMQAVGQLAGGVAHDFNNLLTAMIGFCDLLLMRHPAGDPSFADIMQVKQNANRAANLVRQLLAFSRRQTLQPKPIDLTELLAELSNLIRRLIGENIELKMIHGREVWPIKADQGQLEQVIINLAVNARDAMKKGGALTIRSSNVQILGSYSLDPEMIPPAQEDTIDPGEYVQIDIIDTGHGMPRSLIEKIFEPFFSTKEVGHGTGLGLSTVYGIIKQTGGYIYVRSREEEGTVFTLFFPRMSAQEVAAKVHEENEERAAPSDLTGAATILLVEDETPVRAFAARALRNKGYEIYEADCGENALEVFSQATKDIEVIITDVVMPGMNGPTMIETLYQTYPEKMKNIKVVFISGYAEDAFIDTYGSDREFNFLPKPFTLKQLASKVKEITLL
ncbi:MAG: response regulator [Rickettsiales bacterium]|nr:response regulator [Rickettsiales bacterium]